MMSELEDIRANLDEDDIPDFREEYSTYDKLYIMVNSDIVMALLRQAINSPLGTLPSDVSEFLKMIELNEVVFTMGKQMEV